MDDKAGKIGRVGLNVAAGAIPFVGGILAAIAAAWGESSQAQADAILRQWLQMLQDELREKGKTIAEIMARLDMQNEETLRRIESPEYQALLKKSFRKWSAIDSEGKREKIRNILSHAAASRIVSDDVVSLFIDWIDTYSDFHFEVIGEIFRNEGSTRGQIWTALGRSRVQENSADADLYKMLIRRPNHGGRHASASSSGLPRKFCEKDAAESFKR